MKIFFNPQVTHARLYFLEFTLKKKKKIIKGEIKHSVNALSQHFHLTFKLFATFLMFRGFFHITQTFQNSETISHHVITSLSDKLAIEKFFGLTYAVPSHIQVQL